MAAEGYFVVVYDQRGQGRSEPADSRSFNYATYADDLNKIIESLRLTRVSLLAHSHGGPIAIRFEQAYPNRVTKIALISAPVRFWDTVESIFGRCSDRLAPLSLLRELLGPASGAAPSARAMAVAGVFAAAGQCGLYRPRSSNPERDALRRTVESAGPLADPAGATTAMPGFLANEDYVHFDGMDRLEAHPDLFCAIYGEDDGLFSESSLKEIRRNVSAFALIPNASHSVYLDQRGAFIRALRDDCALAPARISD